MMQGSIKEVPPDYPDAYVGSRNVSARPNYFKIGEGEEGFEQQLLEAIDYLTVKPLTRGGKLKIDMQDAVCSDVAEYNGEGTPTIPTKQIDLFGRGAFSTRITPASGKNVLICRDLPVIHVHDLGVDLPDVEGVKTPFVFDDDGAHDKRGLLYGSIGNIDVLGGHAGEAGLYGLHLKGPTRWRMWGINRFKIEGEGGILIEQTDTTDQWGDGTIEGYTHILLNANNMVGLKLLGNVTKTLSLIRGLGAFIYITQYGARTGLKAIDANYTARVHLNIQAEGMDNFVTYANSEHVILHAPYVSLDTAGLLFDMATTNSRNEIGPIGKIAAPTGTTVFEDQLSTARLVTNYHDILAKPNSGSFTIGNISNNAKRIMRNVIINDLLSENDVLTGQIENTFNSVNVAHGLWGTPQKGGVDPISDVNMRTTGFGATNIVVYEVGGGVAGVRTFRAHAHV